MVKGIVIPHNTNSDLRKQEFDSLADYQAAVGGYIELIRFTDHPLVIVADEDGKAKSLPINHRATLLWWLFDSTAHSRDVLAGDVVVLGFDRRGSMKEVPEWLLSLLFESEEYNVRVCLSQASGTWVAIGHAHRNFFEAAQWAIELMRVWVPPQEVEVVAAR